MVKKVVESNVLFVQADSSEIQLSPAQKRFNSLIKQLTKQKSELQEWQQFLSDLTCKISSELHPIQKQISETKALASKELDQLHAKARLTAKQKETLSVILVNLTAGLIEEGFEELKDIYNRHTGEDYDENAKQDMQGMSEMFREMIFNTMGVDVELSEEDLKNPEQAAKRIFEQKIKMEQEREASAPKRKKTAKQLEKEAKQKEQEALASKSIQAVYRQLVTALHPDREQDPVERERKTELMKQVTVAYEKQDLLKLLELQISLEHIDQEHLNNIAEDRLKHFNKILGTQVSEIKDEIRMLSGRCCYELKLDSYYQLTRKQLLVELDTEILDAKSFLQILLEDREYFEDVRFLKEWIKQNTPQTKLQLFPF